MKDNQFADVSDEYLEVQWNDSDIVAAGQELMVRVQKRIAAAMRYWLYPKKGEKKADYRARREEATAEVSLKVIERLHERGFDRSRGVKLMTYSMAIGKGYFLHWLSAEQCCEYMYGLPMVAAGQDGEEYEKCPPALQSSDPDTSELAEIAMAVDEITKHLKELSPIDRMAFGYTALAGFSVREAAELIGCHPSQVSRHSRAAVVNLVRRMTPDEPGAAAEFPAQFASTLWARERAI